ncbi:MAG: type II secretion system F family protein [Phycisphaerales bacterium]|jgi:tight adherence protein C
MDAIGDKIVIPGLTFLSVMAIGASILMAGAQRRKTLATRVREDARTKAGTAASRKKKSGLLQFLEKIGNFTSHGHASTSLWEELVRAGYYNKATPAIYTGIKMLLFVVGLVSTAILTVPTDFHIATKIFLVFLAGALLFFAPNIFLMIRLKKRHDEISHHLPEAIDLLEICVSSGIGLGMAWNIVADEMHHVSPVLAGAMTLANFEIHLGVSRIEAMRRMATRTGVDKLSSLAAVLVQTERFGTSISDALRVFAASMREERFFLAEERAEKMAVKLIIPMCLFIFPSIFIITAGPAVVRIAEMMARY